MNEEEKYIPKPTLTPEIREELDKLRREQINNGQ